MSSDLYRRLMGMATENDPAVLRAACKDAAADTLQKEALNLKLMSLIERKDAALLRAANQFEFYERNHREKADAIPADTKDDGEQGRRSEALGKALVNRVQATTCRAAAALKE